MSSHKRVTGLIQDQAAFVCKKAEEGDAQARLFFSRLQERTQLSRSEVVRRVVLLAHGVNS